MSTPDRAPDPGHVSDPASAGPQPSPPGQVEPGMTSGPSVAGPHRPAEPKPTAPERRPAGPAAAPGRSPRPPVPSRVGAAWLAAILFALVLLLLLIFILQNGQTVEVSFFGAHGHLPMGIALLLAAVFGVLLVAIPGSVRILQLRIRDRRHRRAATQPGPSGQ